MNWLKKNQEDVCIINEIRSFTCYNRAYCTISGMIHSSCNSVTTTKVAKYKLYHELSV